MFEQKKMRLGKLLQPAILCLCAISYFTLSCSSDSRLSQIGSGNDLGEGVLLLEDSIELEELYKNAMSFKLLPSESAVNPDIWFHDGEGLTINKFDVKGSHINSIKLPTIDEPIGVNRISDFFVYNSDSIFVYDAQYRKLLLVNDKSDVLNLWLINNYVPELSSGRNNEIIDIYKNELNELKIDLSGYDNIYYQSDPNFARYTQLVYQINLHSGQVNRGVPYPENSAYRDHMFWSGVIPYVRKAEAGYIAVFPLDEKVYHYDHDLTPQVIISSDPKSFPRAVGNKYGSQQEMNFARIDRKINGYNLKIRSTYNTQAGQRFAKVYRAPLGDDDAIPDDYATFLQGDYQSKHYLQIFEVEKSIFRKKYQDIEIGHMNLGNLLYIDNDERYYFLKNDLKNEASVILIYSISI